jgi:CheY-like chemotaxis protein
MAKTIVLADDSITIQKIVNLTFSGEGIDVVAVSNGDAAFKKVQEIHPDLVLADIFMPGENGYELCEHIKTNPELSHIPVILLVGAYEPFDQNEAARVKADGHLTKPFEIKVLIDAVHSLISQAEEAALEESLAESKTVPASEIQVPEVPAPAEEEAIEWVEEKAVSIVPPLAEELPVEVSVSRASESVEELAAETPAASTREESLPVEEMAPAVEVEPAVHEQFAHVFAAPAMEQEGVSIPTIDEGDVLGISSMILTPAETPSASPSMVIDIWGQRPPAEGPILEEPLEVEAPGIPPAPEVAPAEPVVEVKASEIPQMPGVELLPAPAVPAPVPAAVPGDGKPIAPAVSPDQEVLVELIAQKVIEKLSRDAIERIAWEVVPDLAELMLKEHVNAHMKSGKN